MAILAGILTAVIGAGLSAGLAAASAPDYANPASSSRKVSRAALQALPGQRQVDQAARLGQRVEYDTGKRGHTKQRMSLTDALAQGLISQQRYDQLTRDQPDYKGNPGKKGLDPSELIEVRVPQNRTAVADFTGYGDADIQGRLAKEMAKIQLDLQDKYGADFIAEAKKQQEQADPEGTAARKLLASEINRMEEERKTRTRPVASGLDSQILDELQSGTALGDDQTSAIAQVLKNRGDTTIGTGDVASELETGPAGEARKDARLQKALSFLSSGQTPADASYRDEQQSLANMANFLSGRTPQSEFGRLAGAQQGASPMPQGPSSPGVDPNMQGNSNQAALQSYGQGIRATANNVNPWFAGLSLLTKGGGAAGAAGYQPFAARAA